MAIKIFASLYKNFKRKKNVYTILIRKHLCWTRLKRTASLATAKQLIRKNFVCCLKHQTIFFTERAYR